MRSNGAETTPPSNWITSSQILTQFLFIFIVTNLLKPFACDNDVLLVYTDKACIDNTVFTDICWIFLIFYLLTSQITLQDSWMGKVDKSHGLDIQYSDFYSHSHRLLQFGIVFNTLMFTASNSRAVRWGNLSLASLMIALTMYASWFSPTRFSTIAWVKPLHLGADLALVLLSLISILIDLEAVIVYGVLGSCFFISIFLMIHSRKLMHRELERGLEKEQLPQAIELLIKTEENITKDMVEVENFECKGSLDREVWKRELKRVKSVDGLSVLILQLVAQIKFEYWDLDFLKSGYKKWEEKLMRPDNNFKGLTAAINYVVKKLVMPPTPLILQRELENAVWELYHEELPNYLCFTIVAYCFDGLDEIYDLVFGFIDISPAPKIPKIKFDVLYPLTSEVVYHFRTWMTTIMKSSSSVQEQRNKKDG